MSDFSEYLGRAHMDAIYVLRLSGIPYLFSTAPIPSRWATFDGGELAAEIDGETYRWRKILRPGDSFGAIGTRIEPKGGVGQSGGCDFDLVATGYQSSGQEDDTLLSLLLSSLGRADGRAAASLAADFPADDSGAGIPLVMVANPWSGSTASRIIYMGTETILATSVSASTATTLTSTVTRGRYGSQAQSHTGTIRDGGAVTGGAIYIADYPLTLVGRIAELWCCPGEFRRDGTGAWTFCPHGASLDDAANRIVYAGVVDGHSEDGGCVTIRTSSLDQLLRGSIMRDTPTVTARTDTSWRDTVYIGAHNWWLHLDLEVDGAVNYPILHISDNADLTAGDTITIGSDTFIAGTDWSIGGSIAVSYVNIANAINAGAGFPLKYSALATGTGVEVRAQATSATSPTATTLSVTVATPGAITITTDTDGDGVADLQPIGVWQILGQRLRRSQNADGQAPFADVPDGLYRISDVASYVSDTMAEVLPPPYALAVALAYEANATAEGGRVVMTTIFSPPRQGNRARIVWITEQGSRQSFLRDLGFTEPEFEMAGGERDDDQVARRQAVANRAPAALRIPAFPFDPPPRIFVNGRDQWTADWLLSAGWEDDDGDVILPHIFSKDVGLLVVQGFSYDPLEGNSLTGISRSSTALGSQNLEEIYIEYSDTEPKVVEFSRVVALPNVSAARMMLYLLLGGSGYSTNDATWDQGWPGCGLHIPARLVALADWTALDLSRPEKRDGWVWVQRDDARKILDEELKASQLQIVSDLGQLRLVAMDVPLEASPMTRRVVGPEQTATDPSKGIGFDRQPNRIVNVVRVKGGWDARTGEWGLEQTNRQQDSIGTWGEMQAVDVELRGLSAIGDAEAKGRAIAQRIFGLYARPYALIEVDLADKAVWLWGIGDEVLLTHPMVPHPTLPRRGCTSMLCRIVNKEARFAGGGKAFATLTLQSYALAGQRYSTWGPSARLVYSGTANTWKVEEAIFGAGVGGVLDSDYFQVGDAVKTMRLGDASSAPTARTIATRTGTSPNVLLTFSAALSGSSGQRYVLWYADHDSAAIGDAQLLYAYMSDFSGSLDLASGSAQAFRYR
jgi:hypothetical protein